MKTSNHAPPNHAEVRQRGRPRSFDMQGAIDAALDRFWRQGYGATATRDLESALGISQSSIYNAFGSKRELFDAALDLYERRAASALLSPLERTPDGLAAIDGFLNALCAWLTRTPGCGCLLTNAMLEASDDVQRRAIEVRASRYRDRVRSALRECLVRAAADGQIAQATVESRTDLLMAIVLGLNVAARTAESDGELARMVGAGRAEVARWRNVRT
ncbi:MAG: TetR/AcrR family transcriptional regulator [Gammaproteobacteria bacterium]